MRDTASIILAGVGGLIQITGFALVWISAARERKRDYDEVGLVRRFWRWLKYQFSAPQPPAHPGYSASDFSAISDSATVQGGTSQLDLLRREIGELRLHVHAFERSAGQRFARVEVATSTLSDRLAQLDRDVSASRRKDLRREMIGTRLFMFGTVLSTLGIVV